MVKDCGASIVELGHSERRAFFNETDETVALKVRAAVRHGLVALVCVGDTRSEYETGATADVLARQTRHALSHVGANAPGNVMLAYEPVWSIGEGGIPADPDFADEQHMRLKRLAADSAGKPLIDAIEAHLKARGEHAVTNLSQSGFYADLSAAVAGQVKDGAYDRAILCCGTGIGVCISANKVPGIRAALTHDAYAAGRAASSNNAQIITMGARVIGPELAKVIVDAWLASEFDPAGPSAENVEAINRLDAMPLE